MMVLLPHTLQIRLNAIVETIPSFWAQSPYRHFTNHGPVHSRRIVEQKLAHLVYALPPNRQLSDDELFILFAAAWLYEVGMQSPILEPILNFAYIPGNSLSFAQLQQIRANKHLLSERLIRASMRRDEGHQVQLGLTPPEDDYIRAIATVCRWCSDEPLEIVREILAVNGMAIRVRLLVALLRLADQLYVDRSRLNLDLLERANLPPDQKAKWWSYHYTQTLPIRHNKIVFSYLLPVTQREYVGQLRELVESQFEHGRNPVIRFLFENGLPLIPGDQPIVQVDQPSGFLREMSQDVLLYLRNKVAPREMYVGDTSPSSGASSRDEPSNAPPSFSKKELGNQNSAKLKTKILFLAANPSDYARLNIEQESRQIDQVLRQTPFREQFDVRYYFAAQMDDLQLYLLDYQPHIVHFSGHGSKFNEIILEDENKNSYPIKAETLSQLFLILKANIRCVVLNACYSVPQAQAIAQHIDCVVGMPHAVEDATAINFAKAFYRALGFGKNIRDAFELGCVQINRVALTGKDAPKLLCKSSDSDQLLFA